MDNAGMSAFPVTNDTIIGSGLTKREYFAAMMLQGYSANPHENFTDAHYGSLARWAVEQADALLAELEKPKEGRG